MYQETINIYESISDTATQHTEMLPSHGFKIIAVYVVLKYTWSRQFWWFPEEVSSARRKRLRSNKKTIGWCVYTKK